MLTKEDNIKKLNSFRNVKITKYDIVRVPVPTNIIEQAKIIISNLSHQPYVAQTVYESIKFIYSNDNNDYLEFILSNGNKLDVYTIVNDRADRHQFYILSNLNGSIYISDIDNIVEKFLIGKNNKFLNNLKWKVRFRNLLGIK